jgi:uncharacterized protein YgfB (UPF0149 family)
MPSPHPPDYDQVSERLSDSPLHPTASEAHGILSGLLCGGARAASQVWMEELFVAVGASEVPDADTREVLRAVADHTRERIESPELDFSLLLPDDQRSLRERALALYDWARGFVYGLGVAGLKQEELSAQEREALSDLAEITRLDLDALDEGEENEQALTELQEFVRVAVLLLYEGRGRDEGGADVQV